FTGAIGVWVGQASHTTVSHNEICDMTYSGVSLGWDWSGHKSTSHHNIIEFNHIHHLGHARMNDMAGVYTLGLSPGSIIRNNLIHDIQAYQSPGGYCLGGGIYLDQSSGDLTVRDNVCHTISNTGFFLHHGTRNRILNNVFAEIAGLGRIGWSLYFSSRLAAADSGNEAVGNIVYGASPKTAKATQAAARGKKKGTPYDFVAADRNVYWATGEVPLTFSDRADDAPEKLLDFAAWRKTGHDGASLVVDPMFEDPAAHDYRLRAESPARALGISSIDVSKAGLYGDAKWRDLPRGVVFRKLDSAVPFLPEKLLFIDEDYEGDKPGTVPPGAKYENRQKGAVIEVTDALAADGRKCLKFADAPGLPASYHPARTWGSLQVHTGTVRLSFDVLNSAERPATLWIEMRDWRKMPYKVGPTLTFRPDGMLELGDGRELPYAHGVWHHVQIILQLGEDAPDSFQMTFGPKGERKAEMTVAFKHKDFEVLTWLGFVAADEDRQSEAYIDNLKLTMD
ncbi:MAG: right-handed parallel beta-helix repeat-containing protein, partial [Lentisphaeria bacterium]|nr:right-handed parallel beta-helix repeat-containing protein [Lentisphaeria bacterium]